MHNGELRLPESGWRILYAFAVVWLATFAALAIFRPAREHEFVSHSTLRFNLAAGNLEPQEFTVLARQAAQNIVAEEPLARLSAQAARRSNTPLQDLPAIDKLQQALQIVLKSDNAASLSIAFSGEGKSYEPLLVNALANELSLELTRQLDGQFVRRWLRELDAQADPTRSTHVAAQLDEELDGVEQQLADCRAALAAPAGGDNMTEQMRKIEAELAALLAAGTSEEDPAVRSLRQQLDWLRPQVAEPTPPPTPAASQALQALHDKTRKNPYFTTAERKPVAEPAPPPNVPGSQLLEAIDLSAARQHAASLLAETKSLATEHQSAAADLTGYFADGSPVALALSDVVWADHPRMRAKRQSLPLSGVIIACFCAACAAYFYDPTHDRTQLQTAADVTRRLGLEVVGRLAPETTRPAPRWGSRLVHRVVRCSEAGVAIVCAVIVLACCAKPMLAQTFLQDPMYGLAHWLALILS